MDADEFQALAAPYLLDLGRLAERLTSRADRDRVVQQALAQAWRTRSSYDASSDSARVWLLSAVVNQARRRRRPSMTTNALVDVAMTETSRWDDPDTELMALPAELRLAVELHYILGLDRATCAAVMACTDADVAAMLDAALRRLLDGVLEIELS